MSTAHALARLCAASARGELVLGADAAVNDLTLAQLTARRKGIFAASRLYSSDVKSVEKVVAEAGKAVCCPTSHKSWTLSASPPSPCA